MIVLWRVNTDCNLACGFCAYDRRLPFARTRVPLDEIARIGRLLGEWRRDTGEDVLLSWLGGEPLLWPELLELSRDLHSRDRLRISATSNGTTLHRAAVRDCLLDAFAELTVSVDAAGAAHEALRGWSGGWPRLVQGVRTLAAARGPGRRPRLRANVVLMRQTLEGFPALCAELADWGIDEITFNQLGGADRPEFHPAHALRAGDAARLRTLVAALRPVLAARGVRLCGGDAYLDRIEASTLASPRAVSACRLPERMLFIDEQCRVSPCSFTAASYGVPTSSLRSVADLSSLRRGFMDRQRAAPAPSCGDCPSTQVFAKFSP